MPLCTSAASTDTSMITTSIAEQIETDQMANCCNEGILVGNAVNTPKSCLSVVVNHLVLHLGRAGVHGFFQWLVATDKSEISTLPEGTIQIGFESSFGECFCDTTRCFGEII